MNKETGSKKRNVKAAEWLADLFKDVDKLPSDKIWRTKDDETTLSTNALKEAKEDRGFRAKQEHDDEGHAAWMWYWPKDARASWIRKLAKQGSDSSEDEIGGDNDEL